MIRIAKYNSSIIEKGRRIIKSFVRSKRDVHTSYQVSNWGDDSTPVSGADIIHAETATDETLIIGTININQKTNPGEKRIFATDSEGNIVVDIYLKNDGTIEMAGDSDNVVKYTPLDTALQSFKNLVNAELVKIAAVIPGGAYVHVPTTIDISSSKNELIKTN